ncbi:MAG: hypothetical protein HYU02_03020 [Thaumarchaeota archaeon]|nr:hypothetical protein [Nitrososphaerota archaeon]
MERFRDLETAELAAKAGGKMIRAYIAELRKKGRIKGKLTVVVRDGKKKYEFPFRDDV